MEMASNRSARDLIDSPYETMLMILKEYRYNRDKNIKTRLRRKNKNS